MWLITVRQLVKTKCQIVTFWWFIIAQNFTIPNLITWAKLIETSVVKIKNSMNETNNITMSCCVNVCLSVWIPLHIYQDCIYEQLHKCGCLLSSETFCHAQQLVRTGLSQSQPGLCEMVALHDLCWDLLFSCQMICKWYIVLTDVLYLELISNPLHLKNGPIPILNHQYWWLVWQYCFLVCQFIFKCRLYYCLHQQLSFRR